MLQCFKSVVCPEHSSAAGDIYKRPRSKILLRARLHMAKNLSTNTRRILNEYSKILDVEKRIIKFKFIFFLRNSIFLKIFRLVHCFRKFYILKKSPRRRIKNLRLVFVGKFFAMCRQALRRILLPSLL